MITYRYASDHSRLMTLEDHQVPVSGWEVAPAKDEVKAEKAVAQEPTAAEYRAFAEEQGIECPARGRIPAEVKAAYEEAHSA